MRRSTTRTTSSSNCCPQSAYAYNSLADFYTDANGYLANPNRTVSPITLSAFQIRYSNIPGVDKPIQPLDVWYTAGYVQDEWRPRSQPDRDRRRALRRRQRSRTRAYSNPAADALTFRDENGQPVQFQTGAMPETEGAVVAARRHQLGRRRRPDDAGSRRHRPLQRPAGLRVDLEPDRQHRRADRRNRSRHQPRQPRSRSTRTSTPTSRRASSPARTRRSYSLNVTDPDFKFPQVWRSNVARGPQAARRRSSAPPSISTPRTSTASTTSTPTCRRPSRVRRRGHPAALGGHAVRDRRQSGRMRHPHQQRARQRRRRQLRAEERRRGQLVELRAVAARRPRRSGCPCAAPTATASRSRSRIPNPPRPPASRATATRPIRTTPASSISLWSPGHRVFALVSYTAQLLQLRRRRRFRRSGRRGHSTNGSSSRLSYTFAGDMNGDSISANDLIYIPRDQSEMNFSAFTVGHAHVHRGRAGGGVRRLHPAGSVSEQAPRQVRRAQRSGDARCSAAWT